uniref:Septum-promoting GTP-binding protein 1 n=1 Tax=Kalanchoe fedtschenkoi TaxID=63787 RepID=A0A7N0TAP7_KALFE
MNEIAIQNLRLSISSSSSLSHPRPHLSMAQQQQQLCRKMSLRRNVNRRLAVLRRCFRVFWSKILRIGCLCKAIDYTQLHTTSAAPSSVTVSDVESGGGRGGFVSGSGRKSNSDLVDLKISLLGDSHIGKTSFLVRYVGNEKEQGDDQTKGLHLMDKTMIVNGARISYNIWEVEGDEKSAEQIPAACKDSVAILFMFDLTSRCTLSSVVRWYKQARRWNQAAIPVIIGTKFDDFIQLPIDLQWTIASEARSVAKALNATLFFSSATYNINVNKIFKFITAKVFDLPWTVERNLTIGEPMIDF